MDEAQQQEAPQLLASVIIVNRNSASALHACLAALEASNDRETIEVIVADNASEDGAANIDSEFPDVSMLRMQHHVGQTKARNIAMRTARAEFVMLLSPDVLVEPDTVARLVARLKEDSAALAVCPLVVDASGSPVSRGHALPDADAVASAWDDPSKLLKSASGESVEVHDGKAILLRKHTIQGINYLDARYGEHWGDVELAFQIKRAGKRITLARDIRVKLSGHALWSPSGAKYRTAYLADSANGAAAYIGKHFGFGAALGLRVKRVLAALATLQFGMLSALLSGSVIDGTDQSL